MELNIAIVAIIVLMLGLFVLMEYDAKQRSEDIRERGAQDRRDVADAFMCTLKRR